MDGSKMAIVLMAINDLQQRCERGQCREMSAEELDALADFGWRLPDIRSHMSARLNAVRGRWRLASTNRAGSMELTSAESS